ncbi:hypothetical protein ACIPY2_15810 [Paenarthrobacter sp. NPDC089675]|uniref:hypothetical protein n=1 Tax=Paenarthrobacter sp. NPDC089675 TaxID=3364376 RepID=UPI0038143646
MSNPQEPDGREDIPRNPYQPGQYPPPPVPPAPGNPSYGTPPYGTAAQAPYPPGQYPPGQYPTGQYPPGHNDPQGYYDPQRQYAQPPARKRKTLWIVLGIVAGVIVLAVVGVLVLVNLVGNATSKARSLADEFTNLVVAGDTEKAYDDYLQQGLKDQLDKQSFVDGIASLDLDGSCKPNYSSVNVNNTNGNNKADVAGTLQCDGKNIELRYVFEGTNDLKMTSIRLRP